MKATLSEINVLRDAGISGQCAIGGAMGATFYREPLSTYNLDSFVLFENPPLILTLTPIYEFLEKRGHVPEGDAIVIHGWPVQFLPAESPLLTEAVQQAAAVDFEGVPTRVMTAEHLMAIALQTGRAKNFSRLLAFIESGVVDEVAPAEILSRHELIDTWSRFKQNRTISQTHESTHRPNPGAKTPAPPDAGTTAISRESAHRGKAPRCLPANRRSGPGEWDAEGRPVPDTNVEAKWRIAAESCSQQKNQNYEN